MSSVDMCEHGWPGTGCKDCLRDEVERLRAELEDEKKRHTEALQLSRRRWCHANRLQAQLAERDALLAGAEKVIDQFMPNVGKCYGLDFALLNETLMGIRAALSASAEPSAPVEVDERAEFVDAWNKRGIDPVEAILIPSLTDDSFANVRARDAYWGWKARAALERKP